MHGKANSSQLYVFKNIRFAAPPVGNLRWAKPAPPAQQSGSIQDGSYGPICVQAPISNSDALNQSLGGIQLPSIKPESEDCLFLDIYVPAKAIANPSLRLPVISWFYGGAYRFGGKDQLEPLLPLYAGTGLLQQSEGNVLFVASNYRVGAYGFLAGDTMEKEGLPNAGLYDQRAALQWIQKYIGLVGGDNTQVSAWGESAGAGSILHQLVAFGGEQDPLFSRTVLQSPSFSLKFDRRGMLEQTFRNFADLAGCAGEGVACLRAASPENLDIANTALFTQGHYTRIPTSLILSHVSDEAEIFVPSSVQTDPQFTAYIASMFPPYASAGGVNAAIEARYPPVFTGPGPRNYTTERARVKDFINESSFVCNVRYLSDAYAGKNYNLQYSVTPGLHAVDLLPTFYKLNLDLGDINVPLPPGFGSFAQAYQSYLTSHARTGNPNTFKKTINVPPAITWPKPGSSADGDRFTGVLNAGDLGFSLITDAQTARSRCDFWVQVAAAVTSLGGYAPPGSVVPVNLVPVTTGDPSVNYYSSM
ncbi:MAG: hypothetical protein Q9197_005593 [Variospora fuerteventurae]